MSDSKRPPPDEQTGDNRGDGPLSSGKGAPAYGKAVPDRFSSDEVFQRIIAAADEEVTSRTRELLFSGIAAGFAISVTFLMYASVSASTDSKLVGSLLYPLGFVYIIIGGYQLYTENTLPPVTLVLERLASVPTLLRHWVTVLTGNFLGGAVGAAVLFWGGVFEPEAAAEALELSQKGLGTDPSVLFFKAVFAGLIVAGVVWVEYAARDTISRLVVVYLAFLAIPMGNLFHVVVSFTEVVYLVIQGQLALATGMTNFVLPVLLGNTVGGVVLVTVVNYFQTSEKRLEEARLEGFDRRLSVPEWVLGRAVGRSYVPILDTAEAALGGDDAYRVVVPVTNPRTDEDLVEFACAVASQKSGMRGNEEGKRAKVHVVHVVQAPDSISLISGGHAESIAEESERMLEEMSEIGGDYDVELETSTVSTHRSFEEVFALAGRLRPDLVLMGWEDDHIWNAARAERPIEELTNRLPCDFLVVKNRGLDASRLLLPTVGGPNSDLCAEVARSLRDSVGSQVSLLHVVDSPRERDAGEEFLREWATEHGLGDAEFVIDDSGDIEGAIEREAEENTMVVIGATTKGLLSRLVYGSLHFDVVEEVGCSVLLAERPTGRSVLGRLFSRGHKEPEPKVVSGTRAQPPKSEPGAGAGTETEPEKEG